MNATSIDRRAFLSSALALGTLILLPEPSSAQGLADISKEAVLNDPEVPVLGNAKGDVTLVEWFDYQCPYCKKAHPEIMRLVRDDGHIRLVMKDWPIFGPSSLYASRLTLAAGPHHETLRAVPAGTSPGTHRLTWPPRSHHRPIYRNGVGPYLER